MSIQYVSKAGTLAADTWRAVQDLLGFPPATKVYLREGFIQVQDNGLTFLLVPDDSPAPTGSTGAGVARAKDSTSGFGPANGPYKGYPVHRLYVRNTTAGSNGTVVVEGVAEVE